MGIGKAIGGIFVFFWRILDGLRKVLHLVVLLFLFGLILAALNTSLPIVPGKTALLLNPQGQIVEQLSGDPVERAIQRAASHDVENETLLRDITDSLEAAAKDKRIRVVVLDTRDMSGAGLSKLQEIAAALRKFKASGKKVIAVGDYYTQGQYYLAAQADEIYLDPMGGVLVDGFDYYRMYMKDALEKLAVDINVFKVGTYKSYTEGYTRTDMSPTEREESRAWLDALWGAYQADVTKARKLQPDALATYANDGAQLLREAKGNAAKLALSRGLVTALKGRDEVGEQIKKIVGEDEETHLFNAIELRDYAAVLRSEEALKPGADKKIGVIVASGEILDGRQPPGTVGGDTLVETIREARYDESVKAVVLRVDSPGGSMMASEQIYRELKAVRAAGKPVVVSMSSTAASGGYYIAAAGNEIWASPTTITGSIGVFAAIPTFQRTLEKIGVNVDGVGTTALSGDFRLDRSLGKPAREILQLSVEHAYSEFLNRVAASRDASVEEVDKVAQGRVWAGSDAKTLGLVDELGSLGDAINAAATRAKLGKDYEVRYMQPELTWRQALALEVKSSWRGVIRALGFELQNAAIVRQVLNPFEREVKRWASFNDPRHLYSYCFCTAP